MESLRPLLEACPTARPDAELLHDELAWAARTLALAARLGLARFRAGPETPLKALPTEEREALADALAALVDDHRALWPARSRPGGLERSVEWLDRPGELLTVR